MVSDHTWNWLTDNGAEYMIYRAGDIDLLNWEMKFYSIPRGDVYKRRRHFGTFTTSDGKRGMVEYTTPEECTCAMRFAQDYEFNMERRTEMLSLR